jgi:ATP-binding cassette subfamily C (CFTR/MRP) protein 1
MATKSTEKMEPLSASSPKNTPTPPSSSCCKSLPNPDHPIPERTSICCSRLLFTWFTPLTNIQITDQTDVWKTPKQDSSKTQTDLLEIQLQQQIDNGTDPKYQLLWALIYTRGWEWLLCSFLKLTGETAQYVMPVLLNELIGWMENKQGRDFTYPIMLSCILVGTMIFRTFVMAYYVNLTCRVGLTRRTAFMGVVINKSLELNSSTASINIGSLINILGNDAEKMSLGSRLFQNAWFQPVALMLCMSLLVHYIGVSAFVGFALMLVLLPCQVLLAKKLTKLRRLLLLKSDARISVVSNLVQGIRAIKLLTWEKFIMQDIDAKRTTELKSLRDFLLINLVNYMLLTSIPIFVAALTFWVYIALGNQLTASTAFTALSLLNMLRGPLFMFPRVLTAVLDGYVGIERAQRLLNMKKCQRYLFVKEKDVDKIGICIDNKSFDWNLVPELKLGKNVSKNDVKSENVNVQQEGTKGAKGDVEVMAENNDSKTAVSLSNINLSLKHTQTGILLGAVGSGKSTLLQALLGECPLVTTNDTIKSTPMLHGSVAYVPQIPFIAQATVRENILFGRPFKLEFYDKCISVCALDTDLKLFPSGDATEIGERGINLSGGQKMRVALCRAMYSEAQIYLLDDPLAAVDANVAEHIWKYGIQEMLQDKIVLMATNAINYCKQVDQIYFVETTTSSSSSTASETNLGNGFSAKLTEQGTLKEIMAIKNGKLAAILAMASAAEDITEETTATMDVAVVAGVAVVVEEDADNNETAIRNRSRSRSISSQSVGGGLRSISTSSSNNGNNNNLQSIPPSTTTTSKTKHEKKDLLDGKLITKENQESGSIKKRAWCAYFNAVGQSFCIIILCIYVTRESARVGMELWMSSWSDVEALRHNAKNNMNSTNSSIVLNQSDPLSDPITSYYLYGYLIWAAVALFVAIFRSVFLLWASLRAAKKTFEGLISSIVHAPMFWYDTTPSGRILNRIASDTAQIDERVPSMLRDTTDSFVRIVGTLILVIIFTPWFCLLLPLVFVLFYDLQEKYRKTTRELKRFGSTTRSPIYNNFNGCLTGMTTIHAFNQLNHWIEKHHDGSDNNFRFGYLVLTASRWSAIRFEFICKCVMNNYLWQCQ